MTKTADLKQMIEECGIRETDGRDKYGRSFVEYSRRIGDTTARTVVVLMPLTYREHYVGQNYLINYNPTHNVGGQEPEYRSYKLDARIEAVRFLAKL